MFIVKYASNMLFGLLSINLIQAITIDNHLAVQKNDCYERLAIGERLDPRDVLRSLDASTVAECRVACSEEGERCLSFSFGIAPKGNGTCELSFIMIKETADLKPIGTVHDIDYDLYIKKTDCKLNISKNPPYFLPLSNNTQSNETTTPNTTQKLPSEDHKPDDFHKPTYVVAILDSHAGKRPLGPDRPPPGSKYPFSYEVNDPIADYDKPHDYYYIYKRPGHVSYNSDRKGSRPSSQYPDVFVFHEDARPGNRPYEHNINGPYQNYYDVPRPLPLPYGPDKNNYDVHSKPNLSQYDDQHYYGMTKPGSHYPFHSQFDRPVYPQNEYRNPHLNRPIDVKHDLDERNRPNTYSDIRRPSYDKPDLDERNRPGIYSDIRRPAYDKHDLDERNRPNAYSDIRRPVYDKPDLDRPNGYFDNRRPAYDKHYNSDVDRNKPYQYKPHSYPEKPYLPELDRNKPYLPEVDRNKPYLPELDRNKPYLPEIDRNKPYLPESDRNKPYLPEADRKKPYLPETDRNKPYRPDTNNYDNPNNYGNWQVFPEKPYSPEPDRNRPHIPNGYDNTQPYISEINRRDPYRPASYDSEHRPIKSNYYDANNPNVDINRRPYDRPYDSNVNLNYDFNRRPAYDKPYGPEPNPSIGNRRPYGPDPDRMDPYYYDTHRRPERPVTPHYEADIDRNRPYEQQNQYDYRRPIDRPYDDPNRNNYRPRPDNYYNKPVHNSPDDPSYKRPYPERPYKPQSNNNWDRASHHHNRQEAIIEKQIKPISSENATNHDDFNQTKQADENNSTSGINKTTTQTTSQGGTVTSIITMIIDKPCYRRALAGKRIERNFIKRAVPCESVEACQRECQDEKRFVCEGFNYRLDETGRGQGDCELTDLPLVRMDLARDVIPDRNYDFYEKDRNSGPDCRPLGFHRPGYPPTGPWHGGSGWHQGDRYPPSGPPLGPPSGPPLGPPSGHGGHYPPLPPPPGYRPPPYAERRKGIAHPCDLQYLVD